MRSRELEPLRPLAHNPQRKESVVGEMSLPQTGSMHGASRQPSKCAWCGVSSHERALVGTRNDRRREQPRWCVRCHPEFTGRAFDWLVLS